MRNILLLILDLLILPITLLRVALIFIFGSKYNIKGFRFLDVIMHADNPYFNQEDCNIVNTILSDYRVTIRDDSRVFPIDISELIKIKKDTISNISKSKSDDTDSWDDEVETESDESESDENKTSKIKPKISSLSVVSDMDENCFGVDKKHKVVIMNSLIPLKAKAHNVVDSAIKELYSALDDEN